MKLDRALTLTSRGVLTLILTFNTTGMTAWGRTTGLSTGLIPIQRGTFAEPNILDDIFPNRPVNNQVNNGNNNNNNNNNNGNNWNNNNNNQRRNNNCYNNNNNSNNNSNNNNNNNNNNRNGNNNNNGTNNSNNNNNNNSNTNAGSVVGQSKNGGVFFSGSIVNNPITNPIVNNPINNGNGNNSNGNNNNNNNNGNNNNHNGNNNNSNGNNNNSNNNNNNNNNWNNNCDDYDDGFDDYYDDDGYDSNGNVVGRSMNVANVKADFKCNLFENVPYQDMLSSINALNQAVNSPKCNGKDVNTLGIVQNNEDIKKSLDFLQPYMKNPETVNATNATDIVNNVDIAVQAAASIANTFGSSDLMNKNCRDSMDGGQIALALNDVVNGLTPYALMAASLTGGTAAMPFILGGTVITSAISSMGRIVEANNINIKDVQVRRAVIENACQYIRLDQRYKFLIKSREDQVNQITKDIKSSQRLFSTKIQGVSPKTNSLIARKNALDTVSIDITKKLSLARGDFEKDKTYMTSTTDTTMICQMGIQMGVLAQKKDSYVSTMLDSLDQALVAYGSPLAWAQGLKQSRAVTLQKLKEMQSQQFNVNTNFTACAKAAQTFVSVIDQSASMAKELIKTSQNTVDTALQQSSDYGTFKLRMDALDDKKQQADRVTGSLDNLKLYASKIAQSEIDSEMDRLRRGLLAPRFLGTSSPVGKWFEYIQGLHRADLEAFKSGFGNLRVRALKLTEGAKRPGEFYWRGAPRDSADVTAQRKAAMNLETFNLKNLPMGTADHDSTCREMTDVYSRWTTALDHYAAMTSFCSMIEPYIYDNRPEDENLVKMCRGYSKLASSSGQAVPSTLVNMHDNLVKTGMKDWALFLRQKMVDMVCTDNATSSADMK